MPIDIHGLQKRYENMGSLDLSSITESVKVFRSNIQGRKKELLKPFGLDDLDKFKDNPERFSRAVSAAVDSFAVQKEQKTLYRKVYEDDRCLVTMPKGPKGAAAAGSMLKRVGVAVCPWCVAIKYPENEKWWKSHNIEVLFFVYARENGEVSNAWCLVLTNENCHNALEGVFSVSHIEDTANKGTGKETGVRDAHLGNLFKETGLNGESLCSIFHETLTPRRDDIENQYKTAGLMQAIRTGDINECKRLLDVGTDVNRREKNSWSALMLAAQYDRTEICRLLIDSGADVNARDNDDWTVLKVATAFDRREICRMLLDAGADVDAQDGNGMTVLMISANCGRLELYKMFIDAGADVNICNKYGSTALMMTSKRGNGEIYRMLLDAGAKE